MRFPFFFVLLLALGLAAPLPAEDTAKPAAEAANSDSKADRKPVELRFDQVHTITYEAHGAKVTRYFQLVKGKFGRFRLIEVSSVGGKEIVMPVLKERDPHAIIDEDDEVKDYPRDVENHPETWVLRSMGFFYAHWTAKRDAPTRPILITAANGLTYRYYGNAGFMSATIHEPGPAGERALLVEVWEKDGDKYEKVRSVDCTAGPAESPQDKK
jgi:hypothetical protein